MSKSNFEFLSDQEPKSLFELAQQAEYYLSTDPETCALKLRRFCEGLAEIIILELGLSNKSDRQIDRLKVIENKLTKKTSSGSIKPKAIKLFHRVRILGNKAAHYQYCVNASEKNISFDEAKNCLEYSYELAIWYVRSFLRQDCNVSVFQYPLEQKPYDKSTQLSLPVSKPESQIEEELKLIQNEAKPKSIDQINETILRARNEDEKLSTTKDNYCTEAINQGLLLNGKVVGGHYEIFDLLGSGNFGEAYLAKDMHKPGEPTCVVKRFKPVKNDQGTVSTAKRLFEKEATILQDLGSHLQIPELYSYFEEEEEFYLVQEYVDGVTLNEKISNNTRFSEQEVRKLLIDILEVLAFVHQKNIIHRDIKPANLIERHEDSKIVLIDFGAVKEATYLTPNEQGEISPGTIIGTQGYMAPEQYSGHAELNSDVYAVGMVAIQALTGLSPKALRDPLSNQVKWHSEVNVSSELKEILDRMISFSTSVRYPTATEALLALKFSTPYESRTNDLRRNNRIKALVTESSSRIKPVPLAGVIIALIALWSNLPYFLNAKIQAESITIGTLGAPKDLGALEDYLARNTVPVNYFSFLAGKRPKITIDGDKTLPYQEAQKRIAAMEWDIAFTLSPINSVYAKDHGYTYAAKMFPKSSGYQSGLFVRASSPIQSLDDIQPTTTVALGAFNSASSFYVPLYDLYGKTLSVSVGHRGSEIIQMVKNGEVEMGAAAIGDAFRSDDPELRIIQISRDIPGAGVYLSPELSNNDRKSLAGLLKNAPKDLQEKSNYGNSREPDYTEFRKIIARVGEISVCSNFANNPVDFFCPPDFKPVIVSGKVNGVTFRSDTVLLKVASFSNSYQVSVPVKVVKQIMSGYEVKDLQGRKIVIKLPDYKFVQKDSYFGATIDQPNQISFE